jgi:hypothetical protein
LAEWSKAPDLGSGPKGRGFKSHSCQFLVFIFIFFFLFGAFHVGLGFVPRLPLGWNSTFPLQSLSIKNEIFFFFFEKEMRLKLLLGPKKDIKNKKAPVVTL